MLISSKSVFVIVRHSDRLVTFIQTNKPPELLGLIVLIDDFVGYCYIYPWGFSIAFYE